jgi:hypothetical protein
MRSTALAEMFGSRAAESVLLHAFHHGETYGRAVAADFSVSLDSVQRQLEKFERSGVFVSKRQGRTLVFSWNPKSRVALRLRDLVAVIHEGIPVDQKTRMFPRRRPRAKDKPVLAGDT